MFGVNNFGAPYYGQGDVSVLTAILNLLRATTRYIAGFNRTSRREF